MNKYLEPIVEIIDFAAETVMTDDGPESASNIYGGPPI